MPKGRRKRKHRIKEEEKKQEKKGNVQRISRAVG
jgi:hypothetical protein